MQQELRNASIDFPQPIEKQGYKWLKQCVKKYDIADEIIDAIWGDEWVVYPSLNAYVISAVLFSSNLLTRLLLEATIACLRNTICPSSTMGFFFSTDSLALVCSFFLLLALGD